MKIAAVEVDSSTDDSTDDSSEDSSTESGSESGSESGRESDKGSSEAESCYDESQELLVEERSGGNWWESEHVSE